MVLGIWSDFLLKLHVVQYPGESFLLVSRLDHPGFQQNCFDDCKDTKAWQTNYSQVCWKCISTVQYAERCHQTFNLKQNFSLPKQTLHKNISRWLSYSYWNFYSSILWLLTSEHSCDVLETLAVFDFGNCFQYDHN